MSWESLLGICYVTLSDIINYHTKKIYPYLNMEEKLERIFEFISDNRHHNKALQQRFYRSAIVSYESEKEKMISLLYLIANTQSQPKIDNLAKFFKFIFNDLNCLSSFKKLIEKIAPGKPINYESLYEGMNNQIGWGQKTAALLCKSVFHLHNGEYSKELKIWDDAPKTIGKNEKFYLPVDAVIIAIFNKMESNTNWSFNNINKTLNTKYFGLKMEAWDDLWFWGFITQNGSGNDRKFEWNENKYWALKESNKDKNIIEEIRFKADKFLDILASK